MAVGGPPRLIEAVTRLKLAKDDALLLGINVGKTYLSQCAETGIVRFQIVFVLDWLRVSILCVILEQ